MLKFYDRYEIWKKSARQEMMRKKKLSESEIDRYSIQPTFDLNNFTLLEDFSIESKLAINKSSITQTGRGDVEVDVRASPVVFNVNKVIYNHLVNIYRCFTYQEPEEIASDMIKAKQNILKQAKLMSQVKKRGENIKTWTRRIAVLSGSYVYIYRESKDLVPEYYMFLKDAIMYDESNLVGENHVLEIKNKFGSIMMAFNSEPIKDIWLNEIATLVASMNINKEFNVDAQEKLLAEQQKKNDADIFNMQLEGPSVNCRWHTMDSTLYAEAELKDLRAMIK